MGTNEPIASKKVPGVILDRDFYGKPFFPVLGAFERSRVSEPLELANRSPVLNTRGLFRRSGSLHKKREDTEVPPPKIETLAAGATSVQP